MIDDTVVIDVVVVTLSSAENRNCDSAWRNHLGLRSINPDPSTAAIDAKGAKQAR